ncbi:AsnC family transcriptional regulator [Halocalculus aciditolerans]|uniref:Transcription regulator n=1 Tax=Halocalculus aciditolerans TaxID=1383812 RepID=A0A830F6Z8_9EURY|nr:AsnC family transcriptional regulator [Halocalculus aciditolerans]GGL60627.1 transcription regulator [Halocalculus aciditolerans]
MRTLDDIDREILRLLAADARRPYSEIAEAVDRSPPTVSERIDRLQELGVVRRFTVDIDRSLLDTGTPILLDVEVKPAEVESVRAALAESDRVEHVFVTADARVVAQVYVPDGGVRTFLAENVPFDAVREYDVSLLSESDWTPRVGEAELALTCAECGNTVTAEGESLRVDGERYHFCCPSCLDRFESTYERLSGGA